MKKNQLIEFPESEVILDDSLEADDLGLSPEEAAFLRGEEAAMFKNEDEHDELDLEEAN